MKFSEERSIEVVGPEGVPMSFPIASVTERAIAFGVDLTAIVLLTVLMILPAIFIGALAVDAFGVLMLLSFFVIRYFYFFFFESRWRGTTPGKRLLNLRVISHNGERLGIDAIFARNLMRDVELFVPLSAWIMPETLVGQSPAWLWLPATGWIFAMAALPFFTKERVRSGDLVAGTRVVRVPKPALLADNASIAGAGDSQIFFSHQQLSTYGEHELETLATIIRDNEEGKMEIEDLRIVSYRERSPRKFSTKATNQNSYRKRS